VLAVNDRDVRFMQEKRLRLPSRTVKIWLAVHVSVAGSGDFMIGKDVGDVWQVIEAVVNQAHKQEDRGCRPRSGGFAKLA
jgi:hypothetical protein